MTELSACPLCSGEVQPHNHERMVGVAAKCQQCKMVFVGYWSDSPQSFAEKFNARAPQSALLDKIEALLDGDTFPSQPEWPEEDYCPHGVYVSLYHCRECEIAAIRKHVGEG